MTVWFFNPIGCWIIRLEYGWGRIGKIFEVREIMREDRIGANCRSVGL